MHRFPYHHPALAISRRVIICVRPSTICSGHPTFFSVRQSFIVFLELLSASQIRFHRTELLGVVIVHLLQTNWLSIYAWWHRVRRQFRPLLVAEACHRWLALPGNATSQHTGLFSHVRPSKFRSHPFTYPLGHFRWLLLLERKKKLVHPIHNRNLTPTYS